MKVVMNAVSAKMGGALAYLRNFLPTLAQADRQNEYLVFVQSAFADEFRGLASNIRVETAAAAQKGTLSRVAFDQWSLRRIAKREGADCIFSTANFGVLYPPAPQVTNIRNPVYFSRDYYRHVRDVEGASAVMRVSARRRMVALSCASSAVVVTPTAAMRDMMAEWNAADPARCVVIHHGFDRERFLSMRPDADARIDGALAKRGGERLLFYPSLYGKHKNFDTLMEGMGTLAKRGVEARLILTCNIDASASPYERRTRAIMERNGLDERHVTLLGPVPYKYMPAIYRAADAVVWPTFAESFGHPLLEAMACGRPIVSSDLAVNREMAHEAAIYFRTFDPEDFADKVEEVLAPEAAARLTAAGDQRVANFSWRRHVEEFVKVFEGLARG